MELHFSNMRGFVKSGSAHYVERALYTAFMPILAFCEFIISGFLCSLTPRLDIIFMVIMHSRHIMPPTAALFIAGIFRDVIYAAPIGVTSVLLILFNFILEICYRSWSGFSTIAIALLCIYGIQWTVDCLQIGRMVFIPYVVLQFLFTYSVWALMNVKNLKIGTAPGYR